jgi:tetratricopeptide (TPR) repeat protein
LRINKRKILQSAQKHMQKGALDKALKDYLTLLEADPRDCNIRLKVGDLHLRRGQTDDAVAAYLKVGAQFMKDGFDAKAVAIYKQVTKIDSSRHEVFEPLASLYQRMGLASEAMAALQMAADLHHQAGRKRDALDLLRKMATLDPTNTTSRLKLAELLRQAGLGTEALAEYQEVADELERQGDLEAVTNVLDKLLDMAPGNTAALEKMVKAQLASEHPDRAEPFANRAIEADPDAPAGYELLARVYQVTGKSEALPDLYRRLAEAHRRRGDEDQARAILQRFVPSEPFEQAFTPTPLPADETAEAPAAPEAPFGEAGLEFDEEDLAGGGLGAELGPDQIELDEADAADTMLTAQPMLHGSAEATPLPPLDAPGAPRGLDAPGPDSSEGDPDQLLAEANVYLRYGKHDRAIASLQAILQRHGDHATALEKLGDAYTAAGEPKRAVDAWLRAAGVARDAGDGTVYEALRERVRALDEEAALGLPDLESVAPENEEDPDLLSDLSFEPEFVTDDASPAEPPRLDEEIEIELDGADPLAPEPGAPSPEAPERTLPPSAPAADEPAPAALAETPAAEPERAIADESPVIDISGQIEEADFYRDQGMLEEAEAVYRRALAAAPGHPQVQLRLGEIEAARGAGPVAGVPGPVDFPEPYDDATQQAFDLPNDTPDPFASSDLAEDSLGEGFVDPADAAPMEAFEAEPRTSSLLAETTRPDFAELDLGVEEELEGEGATEAPPPEIESASHESEPAAPAQAAPHELQATQAEPGDPLQEAEPDVSSRGDFDLAEALSDVIDEVENASAGTEEEGFQALFQDFKRGVSETLGSEDGESRYDLGIAYREMGLFEDALEEFRAARVAPDRRIDALHMMAVCSLELSRADAAQTHLEEALAQPGVPDAQQAALRFDLGRALEADGDSERALEAYREVTRLDPAFPDVADCILRLTSDESPPLQSEAEEYESFDDLLAEANCDDAEESTIESAVEAESEAEVARPSDEEHPAEAPLLEKPPEPTEPGPERRRRKKISFV